MELVVANLAKNVARSQQILKAVVSSIPDERYCACGSALKDAIITSPEHIADDTRERLSAIIGDYMLAAQAS